MTVDPSGVAPGNSRAPISDVASLPLRFGYTLHDLNRLSGKTVRTSFRHRGWDFDERVEMAWSAMAEYLYSCEERPSPTDLMRAATVAMDREIDARLRSYGFDTHDRWKGQKTRSFERYWYGAHVTPSPEENIVDRLAAVQIWERLSPTSRTIIFAKAQFSENGAAAEALGKSRKTFTTQLGHARRDFKAYWHEGEIPSRPWMQDKTRKPDSTDRNSITYVLRRRKRKAAAGETPRPVVRKGRPRKPLAISTDELRRRYESGESIRAIADSLGESHSLVRGHMIVAAIPRRSYSETATLRHRR